MRPGDLPEELNVAERRAVRAAGQVEVIDEQGLLIDGRVPAEWIHRHHRRAVVIHEVAPDLVGAVGQPRPEQQHGGVDRPRAQDHEPRRQPLALAALPYSTATIAPSAPATRPGHERAGLQRHVRMPERVGDPDALAVALRARSCRGRRPTASPRASASLRGRARAAVTTASRPRACSRARSVGDARLVRHRGKGVAPECAGSVGSCPASPRTR